jgi:hypothetical protein
MEEEKNVGEITASITENNIKLAGEEILVDTKIEESKQPHIELTEDNKRFSNILF